MSLLVYKEEGFSLFHLIGAASGTFQTFPAWYACSDSLHFLQATKSQNILTCNFTVNQLLKRSENSLYKAGRLFWITKQGNFTTKWGNNYKVVQYRRQMKETKEIDFGSLLLDSPLICLVTDSLPLGIIKKLKYNQKKEEISYPHHRRICVTYKLEKQLFRGVSCIENSWNSCKISSKLPIMESDCSNVSGATLLKSLSAVDILLPTH